MSQRLPRGFQRQGHLTAHAVKAYAGFSNERLRVSNLATELRSNGDAVASGDLGRIERSLTCQLLTLEVIFANLAERVSRQEYLKNMETYLRLALKAQSQARATTGTLALIKNSMP